MPARGTARAWRSTRSRRGGRRSTRSRTPSSRPRRRRRSGASRAASVRPDSVRVEAPHRRWRHVHRDRSPPGRRLHGPAHVARHRRRGHGRGVVDRPGRRRVRVARRTRGRVRRVAPAGGAGSSCCRPRRRSSGRPSVPTSPAPRPRPTTSPASPRSSSCRRWASGRARSVRSSRSDATKLLTATVVDLAARGALKITESAGSWTLERRNRDLAAHRRRADGHGRALRRCGRRDSLDDRGSEMSTLAGELAENLTDDLEDRGLAVRRHRRRRSAQCHAPGVAPRARDRRPW